jgi:dTDP-4-dehydrorhamnose reductase
MRFAVIGDRGMFGQEVFALLQSSGEQTSGFNRTNLDLSSSPQKLSEVIAEADVIINAVAYTNVDGAEDSIPHARLVNGEYVGKLAEVALILNAKIVHISTDYVFSGNVPTPSRTRTATRPINAYGASKLHGEKLLSKSGSRFQIFRTAWLYGSTGNCFPKAIAKKLLETGSCEVVSDQFGQPTWTRDLAEVVYKHCLEEYDEPFVHAVPSGSASWFDFAQAIASCLPRPESYNVKSILSTDSDRTAIRPKFSVLDNTETSGPIIGHWLDRWKVASPQILASIE